MKVLIVIVNYRTADLTIDALASLEPEMPSMPWARVVVVDNASGDGSAETLAQAIPARGWSDWTTFVPSDRNGGFAYGNNLALRTALAGSQRPQYLMLLNPDTVVRPGAVQTLVTFMDQHPQVGIAGSRLEHPDGTPQLSSFRFPSPLSELEATLRMGPASKLLARWKVAPGIPDQACEVDWVAGASFIVRDKVLDAIGLLDESYFMYFEEVDFCLRAKRAGWPCWYVPESRVVHLIGRASGVTDPRKARKRRPAYWFDSRRRYFLRNMGPVGAGLADIAWTAGYLLYRTRHAIERKPNDMPERVFRDFIQHSVFARGFEP